MDPYAVVARMYEAEYGALEADVASFARHAAPGRLLVLGCGTGRVARRLAQDRVVVGLDRSSAMLDVARRLAPALTFVEGDMRDFDLGQFGEILIPNGGFSFLPTRADVHRCLTACRRALLPGGQLTVDVPMPQFALWGTPHTPETLAWEGVLDERAVRRTRETFRSIARQRLDLVDRYYVDGDFLAESHLSLRIALPGELEWAMEACGLYVDEIVGDYADGPIRDGCPRLLARAKAW